VSPTGVSDPLAPLLELPGVAAAAARARDAVVTLHHHPVNRTGWAASAAEAALRAARASAALDGARLTAIDSAESPIDDAREGGGVGSGVVGSGVVGSGVVGSGVVGSGVVADPVLAGAVRAVEATGLLLGVWRSAPLQALAQLHLLAAADLTPDALGRPAAGSARLALLAELVAGGTAAPAPVLAAVVHGELLALAPFPSANGVVARAAARLTAIASGLDPRGLAVPEVGHLRAGAEYRRAAEGFASGTPDGLAAWIRHCCAQWEAGAREGRSIADARTRTS
jgi:hypothetical protein